MRIQHTIIVSNNSSSSNRRSGRRLKTATEKFVQLAAKLFACDQVYVKVVGENKCRKSKGDKTAFLYDGKGIEANAMADRPL